MQNYILVCIDSLLSATGTTEPALVVAQRRILAGRWPLYARTKHRLDICEGDRALIYAGGQRGHSRVFIATTRIASNQPVNSARRLSLPTNLDGDNPPVSWLTFADTNKMVPTVHMSELLEKLSFIPKNRSRWGVTLMGGVRRISDADWAIILAGQQNERYA